jgi:hypothetical protein
MKRKKRLVGKNCFPISLISIGSNSIADRTSSMLLEPETHPITREQPVNEVKGIYAGLVMVEKYIYIEQQLCSRQVVFNLEK